MNRTLKSYEVWVGGERFVLQGFADPEAEFCQYFEDDRSQEAPEAPLHGCLWPAAHGLATHLWQERSHVAGKKVLEIGCGLGLPGLVCAKAGAELLATDHQPEAGRLLEVNAENLGMGRFQFKTVSFTNPTVILGSFDLIIGSDILYDPDQYTALEDFILRHAKPGSMVLIADPGRYAVASFGARLKKLASYEQFTLNSDGQSIEIHRYVMLL